MKMMINDDDATLGAALQAGGISGADPGSTLLKTAATPGGRGEDEPVPALSITVLNYNYARYLPQCLDSILAQTWSDFEIILINDCSTDNSLDVIEPYLSEPRVRLVNHLENKGYITSLIEGAQLSRGKYITTISADDYCVSDRALASLLCPMEADEEVVLAYCAHGQYSNDGVREYLRRPHPKSFVRSGVEEYRDLVFENYILHSGTIIRAATYDAVGGYEASARYACDTILWLTLCGHGKVAYSADELYAYRRHELNMSVSTRGIRGGLQEHLYGIRKTFAIMQESPQIPGELYLRAIKRNLTAPAIDNVFGGHVRAGWYAYWCAVRIHPWLTVFQTRTLVLLARTLLGPRRFQSLRTILRRDRRSIAPA